MAAFHAASAVSEPDALLIDALSRAAEAADAIGARAILVHAIDDEAQAFYQQFGFESSPLDPKQLMLLMKDLRTTELLSRARIRRFGPITGGLAPGTWRLPDRLLTRRCQCGLLLDLELTVRSCQIAPAFALHALGAIGRDGRHLGT